ncbi:hypothetical protein IJ102_00835 [Candidatus Saccharibacteria bacterium]|nr:hypothetical protein [Candidatus Saccharibacteria bacterium]
MKTIGELAHFFGFEDELFLFSKSSIRKVVEKMIGNSIIIAEKETRKSITLKTIGSTKEGNKKFDNKLFMVDFDNLLDKEVSFRQSQFYKYFKYNVFVYAMYEFPDKKNYNNGDCIFLGFKVLEFDDLFIMTQVEKVWSAMRNTIFSGHLKDVPALDKYVDPVINPSGTIRSAPNFPKSSDGIVFIRGGGVDSSVKPICISGINMYQQFVWLRGDYVLRRLLSEAFL